MNIVAVVLLFSTNFPVTPVASEGLGGTKSSCPDRGSPGEGFALHLVLESSATASSGYKKSAFFSMAVRRQLLSLSVSSSARQKWQHLGGGFAGEKCRAAEGSLLPSAASCQCCLNRGAIRKHGARTGPKALFILTLAGWKLWCLYSGPTNPRGYLFGSHKPMQL